MSDAEASVVLDLPAERAWRAVTAWTEQGRWMPMTAVEVVDGDGELGTTLRARSGLGRLAVTDEMRIDTWKPPQRAEVEHLGRVVTGRGVFLVEALGAQRSRVTWIEQPDPASATGRLGPLVALPTRLLLAVALRRLRRVAAQLG